MNFRDKARAIKEAGAAERGNFEPRGVPLRVYNYWLKNSDSLDADRIADGRKRENFCHFWRVVMIWAPLLFVGRSIVAALDTLAGKVIAGVVFASVVLYLASLSWSITLTAIMVILSLIAAAAFLVGLIYGIDHAINKFSSNPKRTKEKVSTMIFVGIVVAFYMSILTAAYMDAGLRGIFIVVGTTLAIVLFFGTIYAIATHFENIRAYEEQQAAEARLNALMNGEELPEPEHKEPSRVAKFFSGVGDFLVLIVQIVRVKKWKVCPMVEVSSND